MAKVHGPPPGARRPRQGSDSRTSNSLSRVVFHEQWSENQTKPLELAVEQSSRQFRREGFGESRDR